MRCLGLSNQPMALNGNGRHGAISPHLNDSLSPKSASPSPPFSASQSQQQQQQTGINKPPASIPTTTITSHHSSEKQAIHSHSTKSNADENNENGFTLMHPAFQKTKSYKKTDMPKHIMPNDEHLTNRTAIPYPSDYLQKLPLSNAPYSIHSSDGRNQEANVHYLSKMNSAIDDKRGHIGVIPSGMNQCTDDSTDSEEIDLTSNGCIDFSNNNNNNNSVQGHNKCL